MATWANARGEYRSSGSDPGEGDHLGGERDGAPEDEQVPHGETSAPEPQEREPDRCEQDPEPLGGTDPLTEDPPGPEGDQGDADSRDHPGAPRVDAPQAEGLQEVPEREDDPDRDPHPGGRDARGRGLRSRTTGEEKGKEGEGGDPEPEREEGEDRHCIGRLADRDEGPAPECDHGE